MYKEENGEPLLADQLGNQIESWPVQPRNAALSASLATVTSALLEFFTDCPSRTLSGNWYDMPRDHAFQQISSNFNRNDSKSWQRVGKIKMKEARLRLATSPSYPLRRWQSRKATVSMKCIHQLVVRIWVLCLQSLEVLSPTLFCFITRWEMDPKLFRCGMYTSAFNG